MLSSGPSWLNSGDTAWQLTAATLVGIMSIPGLAILYGGIVKRRWAVNSALMVLYAFAMTLVIWMLFAYNMSFGKPAHLGPGLLGNLVGIPHPAAGASDEQKRAVIPLLSGLMPDLRFPGSALVYFQFVFAAITVIILAGSVLGRFSFKAWMIFAPLWITCVYSVGAFMLWGGGWLSQLGAVDYSGGYVIHVAAAVSGFVAAAVVGPRLLRDRVDCRPNNLMMALAGAGLLWLGWSGFNGGDPYFASADAAAAVINTHLCTATALLVWMFLDVYRTGKPNVAGMINGMIAGLVAITPAAGYVTGFGAIVIGLCAGALPWLTMNLLGNRGIFKRVDDTLGVIHTHGFTGMLGGLLTGVFASPNMIVYLGSHGTPDVNVTGLAYGNPHQLLVQAFALLVIVVYDAVATFLVLKVVSLFTPLRLTDAQLQGGDEVIHGDVAFELDGLGAPDLLGAPALATVAAAPSAAAAVVASDGHQPSVAAQLRATLAGALGVDPESLALLSGEQAAVALARHTALEERVHLREPAPPEAGNGGPPKARRMRTRRPAASPDPEDPLSVG
jgi:ammonium transporter, Amt family